jgi:hypothetical protein
MVHSGKKIAIVASVKKIRPSNFIMDLWWTFHGILASSHGKQLMA